MAINFPSNPSDGDTHAGYIWVASENVWRKQPSFAVSDLADTSIASPTDGQALVYDSATSSWINEAIEVPSPTDPIKLNENVISSNYTIPSGYNGLTAGPVTIADGVTVTIADGSAWSIV